MKLNYSFKSAWCAALMFGAMAMANAQSSHVTFSVDMSVQIGLGTFITGTDHVSARGSFNSWAELALVQDGTSTIYTNTANDTTNPNGSLETYKFWNSHNNDYDGGALTGSGKNRSARLPSISGGSVVLPTVFFGDAGPQTTNQVTFQVNMAQQINLGNFTNGISTAYSRGTLNGWGETWPLTNDPTILTTNALGLVTSNVYVGTFTVVTGTNSSPEFKYAYEPGANWENPNNNNLVGGGDNNRSFIDTNSLVLPLVDYSDQTYAPLCKVTLNVDMSVVAFTDPNFNPSSVTLNGDFNGWGADIPMTNNPAAVNTNIYSTTHTFGEGASVNYEYRYTELGNGSIVYDHVNGVDGSIANRHLSVPAFSMTNLPVVLFNDGEFDDYFTQATPVLFSVDMNGAVGTEGYVFNASSDSVYINGQFANYGGYVGTWYPWAGGVSPAPAPAGFKMVEQGTSSIYTNTIVMAAGTPVALAYLYGMDPSSQYMGPLLDENTNGVNHFRVVRSTAIKPYPMPTDKFGNQYSEPFFSAINIGGGDLTVATTVGGKVPVSWLGRPGANLQTSISLSSPIWQNISVTDGTNWTAGYNSTNGFVSVTNWPSSGNTFFRLVKP